MAVMAIESSIGVRLFFYFFHIVFVIVDGDVWKACSLAEIYANEDKTKRGKMMHQ